MICFCVDGYASPGKKVKRESNLVEAGKAASWQQVLEYNTSQNVDGKSVTKTNVVERRDEPRKVTLDGEHRGIGVSSSDHSMEDGMAADSPDGCLGLAVGAASRTDHDSLGVDTLAPRSQSAQDLSEHRGPQSPHHRSTDSLLKDRAGTSPRLDRLRLEDSAVLSRRRSFSGALQKAASAVAVRYRGLRDSVKAASSDLLSGGGHDKLMSKSKKVSLDDLSRQSTAHS